MMPRHKSVLVVLAVLLAVLATIVNLFASLLYANFTDGWGFAEYLVVWTPVLAVLAIIIMAHWRRLGGGLLLLAAGMQFLGITADFDIIGSQVLHFGDIVPAPVLLQTLVFWLVPEMIWALTGVAAILGRGKRLASG